MLRVIFNFKNNKTIIECLKVDKIKDICLKFTSKINININNIYFMYNENILNLELEIHEVINEIDNIINEMNILVYEGIICPKCGFNINIDRNIFNNIINDNEKIENIINGIEEQINNKNNLNTLYN